MTAIETQFKFKKIRTKKLQKATFQFSGGSLSHLQEANCTFANCTFNTNNENQKI